MKTSITHPFEIASVPASAGRIGLSMCPGKHQPWSRSGPWDRSLDADVDAIERWGASSVLTLIEAHEFKSLDVERLGQTCIDHGMTWLWAPIRDGDVPRQPFETQWRFIMPGLIDDLDAGERVFVHCMGGLGRAGTIAAHLLMLADDVPSALAIDIIRGARGERAIETRAQEQWLCK